MVQYLSSFDKSKSNLKKNDKYNDIINIIASVIKKKKSLLVLVGLKNSFILTSIPLTFLQ